MLQVLRPFRVIKYLADNYLEEYDRFFIVGGETFLNPRRLQELAHGISVSQDLYMGQPVDNGDFCSLGIVYIIHSASHIQTVFVLTHNFIYR